MKRVISGLMYNTDTATEVAKWEPTLDRGNFRYVREILYRTKKGNFFIHGVGHGMTRWAERVGDMSGMGEGIEALSDAEAREWCERHQIDSEVIAQNFSVEEA